MLNCRQELSKQYDYDIQIQGFHIKGLLINMFHYLWPELLNFDLFHI